MAVRFSPTVELAPGADLAGGVPATWSWTDITYPYVHQPSKITIKRGRQDRYATTAPSTCNLTLLNPNGIWVPDNPVGPYYGRLDQNTPLRVLVRPNDNSLSDGFNRTASSSWGSADSGGAWTNTGGSASDFSVATATGGRHLHTAAATRHTSRLGLSILRSDQTVKIRVNALSTGAAQSAGLLLRYVDANNYARGELQFNVGGTITARIVQTVAGVATVVASEVTTLTHSTSMSVWLRVQTGYTSVRLKAWQDGTAEPRTWNLDGADGAALAATAGTLGLQSIREAGNTNANATIDFDSYSMVDGPRIQFTGYVDEWPTSWADASETVSLVPVTASGQLRRIGLTKTLKSALYRVNTNETYGSQDAVAYWPMEDGSGATQFGSGLSGGLPMTYTDMSLGSDSSIAGSDPLPTGGTGAVFQGQVARYTSASPDEFCVSWVMKIPAAPSANTGLLAWSTPSGTVDRWVLNLTTGGLLNLGGYASGTDILGGSTVSFADSNGTSLYGRQVFFEVHAREDGVGNVNWDFTVRSAGSLGPGLSGVFPGGLTNVASVWHSAYPGLVAGGYTIGHVAVRTSVNFDAEDVGPSGNAGETTVSRLQRILAEENIAAYVGEIATASTGTSRQAMGAQRTSALLAQLREIEATEEGVLFDGKQGQLTLLPRTMRQNHAVTLTLDHDQGHVGWPFAAIRDDFLLRTEVNVNRPGGARGAVANDATAARAVGVYSESLTINVQDDDELQQRANWRLNMGSTREIRYPQVPLNLTRNQSLISAWLDCDIGSRISITNMPTTLTYDDLDLLLEGYTEVINSQTWTAVLNTSPARPWSVFRIAGGGNLGRLGTSGSTLVSDVTSTATSLSVATTTGALWRTGAVNFDIGVAGERMTVTFIVGSSSPQTFTVTRSVNGVVKPQSANAAVSLWKPGVLAP